MGLLNWTNNRLAAAEDESVVTLISKSTSGINSEISKHLKKGYVLQGSISTVVRHHRAEYYATMVLAEQKKEQPVDDTKQKDELIRIEIEERKIELEKKKIELEKLRIENEKLKEADSEKSVSDIDNVHTEQVKKSIKKTGSRRLSKTLKALKNPEEIVKKLNSKDLEDSVEKLVEKSKKKLNM